VKKPGGNKFHSARKTRGVFPEGKKKRFCFESRGRYRGGGKTDRIRENNAWGSAPKSPTAGWGNEKMGGGGKRGANLRYRSKEEGRAKPTNQEKKKRRGEREETIG